MKSLPYIIIGLVVLVAGWLVYSGKLSFGKTTTTSNSATTAGTKTETKTVFVKSDPVVITKYIQRVSPNNWQAHINKTAATVTAD